MDIQHKPHQLSEAWQSADVVFLRHTPGSFASRVNFAGTSLILHEMFTVPYRPSANIEIIDGFPVVVLHDDPQEVEAFLTASRFFMPPPASTQLGVVIGILRLSHKYGVPFLRCRALEHLETLYANPLGFLGPKTNVECTFSFL
ncbi:hypothetical protein B0H13DRAFT_2316431 [Mycena leptocephala]|nr:hypothetical protein B0H13DRAFT_2316431 [Mycena leptocephala]